MKRLVLCAALTCLLAPPAGALAASPRAVATFESLGLYWTPPSDPGAAGCPVRYRKSGDAQWRSGLPLWYDSRNRECRGSLVMLSPGTTYEVQLSIPGGKPPLATLTAKTWPEQFPVAKTVLVESGSQTLRITEGGSAVGYVLYTAAPGAQATIDVGDKAASNVTI